MSSYYRDILRNVIAVPVEDIVEFLRTKGVLKRTVNCPTYHVEMSTVAYKRNSDKLAFRCLNKDCNGYSKYHSIRKGSVLDEFTVPLNLFLEIVWLWFINNTHNQIKASTGVSVACLSKVLGFLRQRCGRYNAANPLKLGGEDIVVQIDESLFRHKQKYHVGRQPVNEIWVFGLADTSFSPSKVVFMVVQQRNVETLLPLIRDTCLPGTEIHSDGWAAYRQNIESAWNRIKAVAKIRKGIKGFCVRQFLDEMIFKTNVAGDDFEKVFLLLRFN